MLVPPNRLYSYTYLCFQKTIQFDSYMSATQFIATMTVEQFVEAISEAGLVIVKEEPKSAPSQESPESLNFSDSSRWGCGLKAIRDRYRVANLTAQRYKDGILAPAIIQGTRGGKFWIDYAKADKIMAERKKPKKEKENAQTVTA